jgi:hypothetical protein
MSAENNKMISSKKSYKSPSLIYYGAIKDLTSGGTGKAAEGEKGKAKPRP